jgi:TonB family protein
MRMLAVVLGVVSISAAAQTIKPGPMPELKTVTPETVTVSRDVLRGMAEAEPDIATPAGATEQGYVLLRVAVSKTGAVQEALAVSGPEDLRKVAAGGVMGWSYRPYLLNGQPREVQSMILLAFDGGVGKRAPVLMDAVRVSSEAEARLLVQPVAQPVYPPIARAAHVEGTVVLRALISKSGDVEDVQVISGPPMLTAAAMDAVKQWKYRPYLLNGMPEVVQTTINVNFKFADLPKQPNAHVDTGSATK